MPGKPKSMLNRPRGRSSDAKTKFNPRTGEETNKPDVKDPRTIYRPTKEDIKPTEMRTGGLSPKQKKIAAKAPPPDKIDGKDFAVLKAEKAKGRGMGLQDEKIKPGKVMKANKGKMTPIKKDPTTPVNPFEKRRKQLGGGRSKLPGKIGTALGVVSMLVPAGMAAAKQYKDYKSAKNRDKAKVKKMGGGMAKKYNKGGGADTGRMGELKSKLSVAMDRASRRSRDKDRLTTRDKEEAINLLRRRSRNEDRITNRDIESASSAIKGYDYGGKVKTKPASKKRKDEGLRDDTFDPIMKKPEGMKKELAIIQTEDAISRKNIGDGKKMTRRGLMKVVDAAADDRQLGRSLRKFQRDVFKTGGSVMARGCKLGRTKKTKLY